MRSNPHSQLPALHRWVIPSAIVLASCAAFVGSGCECGRASDDERERERERYGAREGAGGEETIEDASHGPAVRLREPSDELAAPSRFEPVDPALAAGSTRARGWASLDDVRRGARARMSLGNWLCRLWTHYGPPPEVQRDGFVYAFRDRESGDVITAYSAGSGPALGGVLLDAERNPLPGAEARVAASVDAFAAMIDATEPRPCELELDTDFGRVRVGVRDGAWFEEELE